MASQEEEYTHNVWEIYRKEWETASPEKKVALNKRMRRWQELIKSGLTAEQAYILAMEDESDKSPVYTLIEEELDIKVAKEPSDKSPGYSFWSWMPKAVFFILGLALVTAIVFCIVINGKVNTLNTELESVQSVLASTQAQLSNTQADLSSTKQTLVSTQGELSTTKQKLTSTQTELSSTKQTLASTQTDLTSTKQTLASTQQQLAVAQETLGGLGITLYTSKDRYGVALIDNPTATNPTWNQLKTFLSQDQTDKHTYIEDVYDCTEYSWDVHNNAEAAGIRAAVVHIDFKNEWASHALNVFLTSDYGLVYVDCSEMDTIARIKAGKEYRAVGLYEITATNVRNDYWWNTLSSYYYLPSSLLSLTGRGSVTSSIEIYW
ncbi:hypothetical protein ACFLX6_02635 [Chloroflexota bacterium]